MAHDRQIEREQDQPEQSSGLQNPEAKLRMSLDVLGQWWEVYGQIYRDDPTKTLLVSFREILKPLLSKPDVLHEALLIGARESPEFRPKPGRIFEIAEALMARRQQSTRPKYLDEPPLSPEEREAAMRDFPLPRKASA